MFAFVFDSFILTQLMKQTFNKIIKSKKIEEQQHDITALKLGTLPLP